MHGQTSCVKLQAEGVPAAVEYLSADFLRVLAVAQLSSDDSAARYSRPTLFSFGFRDDVMFCLSAPQCLVYSRYAANINTYYYYQYCIIPSLFHSRFESRPFLQIIPTVAFHFFFTTDSTDSPDRLPILLSIFFSFYFFPFLVVGSVR